jgi:hypothetical protein
MDHVKEEEDRYLEIVTFSLIGSPANLRHRYLANCQFPVFFFFFGMIYKENIMILG